MIFVEIESGKSVENREIHAYKTDLKTKAPKYLYLIGGTHGDEVEGVYVLKELFAWLKVEHNLIDMPIIVVPILNPDGYRTETRVNAHSVDLNRNYATKDWTSEHKKPRYYPGPKPLSEPENQFLIKLFDKYKPGLILSFHTWKPMVNYNGDCKDISEVITNHNHYELTPDIGYPTPGSLGTFVNEKYNAPVITFECPELKEKPSLKDIWQENEEGLKAFFKSELLTKYY